MVMTFKKINIEAKLENILTFPESVSYLIKSRSKPLILNYVLAKDELFFFFFFFNHEFWE